MSDPRTPSRPKLAPQAPPAAADRLRIAAKQAAKGTWTFEATIDAPFMDELSRRAGALIGQRMQQLNNGQPLDEKSQVRAITDMMGRMLQERAEIMGDAVERTQMEFARRGWEVISKPGAVVEVPHGDE